MVVLMNRNRDFSDYSSRIRQGFSFGKFWRRLTPGQIVLTGFVLIAIIGMFLLMLPVSNVHGWWTNWLDALFTSTSAVCVTGLVVLDTGTYWSLFGQIVIILLIQIGGLGFMTMMTFFFLALGKRVTFHDRLLLQSSVNSSHVQGIIQFVKYILGSAFAIEAVGGILLSTVFIPQYGWGKGIWFGFWHSISMYCNAGFDLIGGFQSFTGYVDNWTLSLTVCALIVIGGLGFSVYVDLIEYFGSKLSMKKIDDRKVYSKPVHALSVHSKIVLVTTGVLIVGGAFTFYMLERSNPATMGNLSGSGKFLASLFQSVTPRTAGANTIDQAAMTSPSRLVTNVLMFIGGSPGSTAGGIKTTCIATIFITVWSVLMGKKRANCFHREIPSMTIRRAMCVFTIGMAVVILTFFIVMVNNPDLNSDFLLFEVFSAFDTVGLTCGVTTHLSSVSRMAIIIAMMIGRVGPLTIASVLTSTEKRERKNEGQFKLPDGNILIG